VSGVLGSVGTTVGTVAGTATGLVSTAGNVVGAAGNLVGAVGGAANTIGGLFGAGGIASGFPGAMGGLANLSGLGGMTSMIASTLAEASFRGVTFSMPSSEDEAGRRVVQMFFPGVDEFAVQDTGKLEGPIHIRGLICGDDYVIRAERMRQAVLQQGPGTLIHPWWGELTVRLVGQPARIGFDENQQGIATLDMVVVREPKPPSSGKAGSQSILDSLTSLLSKADAMIDSGVMLMQGLLSPLVMGVALVTSVQNSVAQIGGMFGALLGSAPEAAASACAAPLAALNAGVPEPTQNVDTTYADAVTDALVGVPVAIADAVTPAQTAAVAPAQAVTGAAPSGVDPRVATTLLLTAASQIATIGVALAQQPGGTPALTIALVASAACVSQAIATASGISFTSTQDALATRDTVAAALDALTGQIVAAGAITTASVPAPAALAQMLAAVMSARAALFVDISSQLGRLPSVVTVPVPREMSAWLLAYALAGDTVADVVPMLDDMVTRNLIANPAIVPAGTVQVLEQPA
jgi:prophage DNA circulation protein